MREPRLARVVQFIGVGKTWQRGDERVIGLDCVSFTVEAGQWVALVGPSGSGKSTTLNVMSAVDRPDSGTAIVCGVDLGRAGAAELLHLRRHSIGVIFQSFHLMPHLTVAENVELPLRLAGRKDPRHVQELIARVGLEQRSKHFPGQLSGGEQQRTAVARALVHRPQLVLADEPTGNLDSVASRAVLDLLDELRSEQGSALVMATHEMELAEAADRVLHFRDGRRVDST